jgi:hypothetical protein
MYNCCLEHRVLNLEAEDLSLQEYCLALRGYAQAATQALHAPRHGVRAVGCGRKNVGRAMQGPVKRRSTATFAIAVDKASTTADENCVDCPTE